MPTVEHCNTLQHTATHCNTLQHTATYYITLYFLLEFPTEPVSCDRPYHSPGNMCILVTREEKTDFSMHLSYDPSQFEQVCCSVCCSVLQCVAARCPKQTRSTAHSIFFFYSNIPFTLDTDTTQTQHTYNTDTAHIQHRHSTDTTHAMRSTHYGVASISRLLKILGLFCKRAI